MGSPSWLTIYIKRVIRKFHALYTPYRFSKLVVHIPQKTSASPFVTSTEASTILVADRSQALSLSPQLLSQVARYHHRARASFPRKEHPQMFDPSKEPAPTPSNRP